MEPDSEDAQDEMITTSSPPPDEQSAQGSSAAPGSPLKDVFTRRNDGTRVGFLSAKKVPPTDDKEEDPVWETEQQCRDRVGEFFEMDDVDCHYDEDRHGFVAKRTRKPRPSAAKRRKLRAAKAGESEDPSLDCPTCGKPLEEMEEIAIEEDHEEALLVDAMIPGNPKKPAGYWLDVDNKNVIAVMAMDKSQKEDSDESPEPKSEARDRTGLEHPGLEWSDSLPDPLPWEQDEAEKAEEAEVDEKKKSVDPENA
jgi:hypothetical protein